MKLPVHDRSVSADLSEFDVWITSALVEIRETDKYKDELNKVASIIETIGEASEQFADIAHTTPDAIAERVSALLEKLNYAKRYELLEALGTVLFLVTGKTNNNLKCQLPLFLRDEARWDTMPVVRVQRGKTVVEQQAIPRVLKMEQFMENVALLQGHPDLKQKLLATYLRFVLSDEAYQAQLWSIGRSYFMLKTVGRERHLLAPIVVFQVRGSVSASGGHDPEGILRERMDEWGLAPGVDYNTSDVVVAAAAKPAKAKEKTRAYDFVLPFRTPGWAQRLYVQCQFYAGDSGSVSHKNVDQTSSSRAAVLAKDSNALFIEFVDGAGYFSSLNGDLKTLLGMASTRSFFQVRSAPIRLRRELQGIGFLAPIEVGHAVYCTDGRATSVRARLRSEGYSVGEIERALGASEERGFVKQSPGGTFTVCPDRSEVVRRYLLLDIAARTGATLDGKRDELAGSVLIPGYGPFFGVKLDRLAAEAERLAPGLRQTWGSPRHFLADVRWLAERRFAMMT